jgi:hypothetical protein
MPPLLFVVRFDKLYWSLEIVDPVSVIKLVFVLICSTCIWWIIDAYEIPQTFSRLPPLGAIFLSAPLTWNPGSAHENIITILLRLSKFISGQVCSFFINKSFLIAKYCIWWIIDAYLLASFLLNHTFNSMFVLYCIVLCNGFRVRLVWVDRGLPCHVWNGNLQQKKWTNIYYVLI